MLERLTIDDFRSLEDSEVRVRIGGNDLNATVIAVSVAPGGREGGRGPFSVVLRCGPVDRHFHQGVYTLEHPEYGPLELFMVPIGPDRAGMRYEISFS